MATLKEQDIVLHTKDANGNPVIQLPITRLENVEGQDTKLVHTTGNETIAGKKTFSDSPKVERVNPYVDIVQTDITKGTAPSATSYAGLRFGGSEGADSDEKRMGAVHHNYYSNGANIMRLEVTKPVAGSTETASVSVAYGADGKAYATAPTPVDAADKSTKIATTEWVQNKATTDLAKYLPLAGGTMTGGITFDSADVGSVYSDGKDLCLGRGTNGSILRLRGHDTDDNAGGFHIRAMDAEGNYWYLIGYADGRLTWGSYDIINAYGGTMQGKLKFLDDGAVWSDGSDLLVGDSSGALLRLRNLENPEMPGVFQIRASNGDDKNVYLIGNPDGGLTWNGKDVTLEGDCLPLAGGTMSGTINFKNNTQQKIYVDSNGDLVIGDNDVGALLRVRGNASDSNPGGFQFRAQDSSASKYLIGKPDGTLTWNGKDVITSEGGQIDGTFRANTEGFVTGVADDDAVRVSGGTGWDNGGSIVVYGKSHASYAGMFRVKAEDGTNEAILLGKPDGTLTWGGKDVITSAGGNITGRVNTFAGIYFNDANGYYTSFQKINDNGFFIENRTPDSALRSRICFRDDKHATPGRIEIDATNSTNKSSLILYPDGTATWAGKPIATGATASKANNGYFRDSTTGLTIQWGVNSLTHQTATTVTFPKAFTAVYSVVVQSALTSGWNSDNNGVAVTAKTTTNFTARTQAATSNYYWIAIGYCAS